MKRRILVISILIASICSLAQHTVISVEKPQWSIRFYRPVTDPDTCKIRIGSIHLFCDTDYAYLLTRPSTLTDKDLCRPLKVESNTLSKSEIEEINRRGVYDKNSWRQAYVNNKDKYPGYEEIGEDEYVVFLRTRTYFWWRITFHTPTETDLHLRLCSSPGQNRARLDASAGRGIVHQPDTPLGHFIEQIAPLAQAEQHDSGVPASFSIAQAIHESWVWKAHAPSFLATKYNNYHGIRCSEPKELPCVKSRNATTGNMDSWNHYSSPLNGFLYHGRWLRQNRNYRKAFDHTDDPLSFAREVLRCYTGCNRPFPQSYYNSIVKLIDEYDLRRYDVGSSTLVPEPPPSTSPIVVTIVPATVAPRTTPPPASPPRPGRLELVDSLQLRSDGSGKWPPQVGDKLVAHIKVRNAGEQAISVKIGVRGRRNGSENWDIGWWDVTLQPGQEWGLDPNNERPLQSGSYSFRVSYRQDGRWHEIGNEVNFTTQNPPRPGRLELVDSLQLRSDGSGKWPPQVGDKLVAHIKVRNAGEQAISVKIGVRGRRNGSENWDIGWWDVTLQPGQEWGLDPNNERPLQSGSYSFRVSYRQDGRWHEIGNEVNFTAQNPPRPLVGTPRLSNPPNGSSWPQNTDITLTWNPSSGAIQYKVELWGGPYSKMTPCDWQNSTSCHIGQLWPGTMYWHVKARNANGQESSWSDTWSFTIQ